MTPEGRRETSAWVPTLPGVEGGAAASIKMSLPVRKPCRTAGRPRGSCPSSWAAEGISSAAVQSTSKHEPRYGTAVGGGVLWMHSIHWGHSCETQSRVHRVRKIKKILRFKHFIQTSTREMGHCLLYPSALTAKQALKRGTTAGSTAVHVVSTQHSFIPFNLFSLSDLSSQHTMYSTGNLDQQPGSIKTPKR